MSLKLLGPLVVVFGAVLVALWLALNALFEAKQALKTCQDRKSAVLEEMESDKKVGNPRNFVVPDNWVLRP